MLKLSVATALAVIALGATSERALSAWIPCSVPAAGGYHNCLNAGNPSSEGVKADASAGVPYRFQLARFSDGARWGWWEWNNTDYHIVLISISGTITAQVDNRGATNSTYNIEMY